MATASVAMARISPFEGLPSEIHVQIMLDLEDTDYLYDLIRASPRLLHVFGAYKARILRTLALGGFHPSVRLHALSVARMCELPHPVPADVAFKLLEVHIADRWDRLMSVTTVARSVTLCKLSKLMEFFIDDYVTNTLPIMERLDDEIETSYSSDTLPRFKYRLSLTEYARLQRAFCRFELYCHLFGQCSPAPDPSHHLSRRDTMPDWQQARLFLLQLRVSEIVEIHCVRDYLERRLRGALDEVEDYAVKVPRPRYRDFRNPCADGSRGCPRPFQYGRYDIEDIIEHLTSLGLGYVRRIFETGNDEEKTDLILHGSDTGCGYFIGTDFLSAALDVEVRPRNEMLEKYKFIRGTWSNALAPKLRLPLSSGFKWFVDGVYNGWPLHPHCPHFKGVRDWGYVFWDFERLEEAGIFDQDPSKLALRKFDRRFDRKKSVQERLMGTRREAEYRYQRLEYKRYSELEDANNDSEEEFEERDRLRRKRL